jgi:hypothetical protein
VTGSLRLHSDRDPRGFRHSVARNGGFLALAVAVVADVHLLVCHHEQACLENSSRAVVVEVPSAMHHHPNANKPPEGQNGENAYRLQ